MIEINNKTRAKIDIKLIKKTTEIFFNYYKIKNKELSIAFIGDTVMRRLNKQYRGKDMATDVLSFCGNGNDFGEVLIDYAQIKRQAKKYSKSTEEELIFILVHGLLHLIGYEDETKNGKIKMKKLGEEFIFHMSSKHK